MFVGQEVKQLFHTQHNHLSARSLTHNCHFCYGGTLKLPKLCSLPSQIDHYLLVYHCVYHYIPSNIHVLKTKPLQILTMYVYKSYFVCIFCGIESPRLLVRLTHWIWGARSNWDRSRRALQVFKVGHGCQLSCSKWLRAGRDAINRCHDLCFCCFDFWASKWFKHIQADSAKEEDRLLDLQSRMGWAEDGFSTWDRSNCTENAQRCNHVNTARITVQYDVILRVNKLVVNPNPIPFLGVTNARGKC